MIRWFVLLVPTGFTLPFNAPWAEALLGRNTGAQDRSDLICPLFQPTVTQAPEKVVANSAYGETRVT
jgi:hypothetical protein